MIIVQHIETRWTKRSRGMPGAAARNAVPRVMPLPPGAGAAAGIYLHRVTADEDSGFDLHQVTGIIEPGQGFTKYWTLRLVPAKSAVVVEFGYVGQQHGQPPRREHRHPVFRLEPGEVGTLHINGRFSYNSGQYYKQHFVNIANVEAASRDLFTGAAADHFSDMTADLF